MPWARILSARCWLEMDSQRPQKTLGTQSNPVSCPKSFTRNRTSGFAGFAIVRSALIRVDSVSYAEMLGFSVLGIVSYQHEHCDRQLTGRTTAGLGRTTTSRRLSIPGGNVAWCGHGVGACTALPV